MSHIETIAGWHCRGCGSRGPFTAGKCDACGSVEAHLLAEDGRDEWKARATAAERLAHRLQHGTTIEGDDVCPERDVSARLQFDLDVERAQLAALREAYQCLITDAKLGMSRRLPEVMTERRHRDHARFMAAGWRRLATQSEKR